MIQCRVSAPTFPAKAGTYFRDGHRPFAGVAEFLGGGIVAGWTNESSDWI
jgi:hypothetical protein